MIGWPAEVLTGMRAVVTVTMIALGLSTIAMPEIARRMSEAFDRTTNHATAWIGQHGRMEYHDLLRAVVVHREMPTAQSLAALILRHEIFQSRIETWRSGAFARFVDSSPERRSGFDAVLAGAQRLDRLMVSPAAGQRLDEVLESLLSLERHIIDLAAQSFHVEIEKMNDATLQLGILQKIQAILIALLIVCCFLFYIIISGQNRKITASNVAQRRIAEENAYLAAHDALTGLPNRSTFFSRLDTALRIAKSGHTVCVIAIDLDGFKPVNDVLGHKAGDHLLIAISERLRVVMADVAGGLVARMGGDEFLLLVEGIRDAEMAEAFAEGVLHALRQPNAIDGHTVSVDASLGLAVLEDFTTSGVDLANQADVALQHAKGGGKGRVVTFAPSMLDGLMRRRRLEADLAEADIAAQFAPHYQPIVNLATGAIVGVEALARWTHPNLGPIPPTEFIPIAEASGRVVDIGRHMIEAACADATRFPAPVPVSVNLSAVQFVRTDVPELVSTVLARTGLAPARLKLEVTESVMIHDARGTRQLIDGLQRLGVCVSLDDFGTGYSSLSYLRDFSFDALKIDRGFIAEFEKDPKARAIVQSIVGLAHSLDMSVVAEGIETGEQARLVMAVGCLHGQGYHFARPMPFQELRRMMASRRAA
jgi:diguanylate cyclase (GGDEF)-like protein